MRLLLLSCGEYRRTVPYHNIQNYASEFCACLWFGFEEVVSVGRPDEVKLMQSLINLI